MRKVIWRDEPNRKCKIVRMWLYLQPDERLGNLPPLSEAPPLTQHKEIHMSIQNEKCLDATTVRAKLTERAKKNRQLHDITTRVRAVMVVKEGQKLTRRLLPALQAALADWDTVIWDESWDRRNVTVYKYGSYNERISICFGNTSRGVVDLEFFDTRNVFRNRSHADYFIV